MQGRKDQHTLTDPRSAYPRPPFPDQPQDAPGSTEAMQPRPDHGEESYRGSGRLDGRRALITGGDSGIGRATAIAYHREGAQLVINHLPEEKEDAASLKALVEGEGGTCHLRPGDLKDESFARGLVREAADLMGGLDILVCNAARQIWREGGDKITSAQWDEVMKTNLYAVFWMNQEALEVMPAGGSIIDTTSVQGFAPSPTLLDYATTKFAIRGFIQGLAPTAMQEKGIRVNGVAPGPFWTPLQPAGGQSAEKVQHFGASSPVGRPGQPAEIAPAFVFLASGESSYMIGEIVSVTGGQLMM